MTAFAAFSQGPLVNLVAKAAMLSPVSHVNHITSAVALAASYLYADQVPLLLLSCDNNLWLSQMPILICTLQFIFTYCAHYFYLEIQSWTELLALDEWVHHTLHYEFSWGDFAVTQIYSEKKCGLCCFNRFCWQQVSLSSICTGMTFINLLCANPEHLQNHKLFFLYYGMVNPLPIILGNVPGDRVRVR